MSLKATVKALSPDKVIGGRIRYTIEFNGITYRKLCLLSSADGHGSGRIKDAEEFQDVFNKVLRTELNKPVTIATKSIERAIEGDAIESIRALEDWARGE